MVSASWGVKFISPIMVPAVCFKAGLLFSEMVSTSVGADPLLLQWFLQLSQSKFDCFGMASALWGVNFIVYTMALAALLKRIRLFLLMVSVVF